MTKHQFHKHKNLLLLVVGIIFSFWLSHYPPFREALLHLDRYIYLGAFLAGMLFVCSFTLSIGAVMLVVLGHILPPWQLGLVAGLGAMVGDFIIFHIIRDDVMEEIAPVYRRLGGNHLTKILHTKYFSWTLPVVGALIMISPLPNELGVSLLDLSGMKHWEFLLVSCVLNMSAMFFIALAVSSGSV